MEADVKKTARDDFSTVAPQECNFRTESEGSNLFEKHEKKNVTENCTEEPDKVSETMCMYCSGWRNESIRTSKENDLNTEDLAPSLLCKSFCHSFCGGFLQHLFHLLNRRCTRYRMCQNSRGAGSFLMWHKISARE